MGEHTVALTQESFDSTIKKPGLVLVDFWAAWCGPCRAFAPTYEKAAAAHADVTFGKVDTEAEEALSQAWDIESIPTLVAFRDGVQVHRDSGALSGAALEALIARLQSLDLAKWKTWQAAAKDTEAGKRPAGVPEGATWDPKDSEWCHGALDEAGEKHGPWRFWRADGTLCNECNMVHGKPHGPFKRFHETGGVSQEGQFVDGELHGTRAWVATDAYTTERMHENGVCLAVRRTEMDYEAGRVVAIRHFDAQGRRVMPTTGEPYPDRPAALPKEAEFIEKDGVWAHVQVDKEGQREGRRRLWSKAGVLLEEGTWKKGKQHGLTKRWNEKGELVLEAQYVDGARSGRYVEAADEGELQDERVARFGGTCEQDYCVGTWLLTDAKGATLATRDFGAFPTEEDMKASAVFSNRARPAAEWHALSKQLLGAAHVREALLATARGVAMDGKVQPLVDQLARHALPRTWQNAQYTAVGAINYCDGLRRNVQRFGAEPPLLLAPVADTLLRGGDAAMLLRFLAIQLDQKLVSRAALDFIDAAVLLAPDRVPYLFNRGLILMSLGLDAQAQKDADALAAQPKTKDQGELLRQYGKLLFPGFAFWPAKETAATTLEELPEKPAQGLAAVKAAAQKYATRLGLLRKAVEEKVKAGAKPAWMPPDVSALLPDGPVALEERELEPKESDDGEEAQSITVDETLDAGAMDLPALLRAARADWSALCWLCWSCGLKEVALPKALTPPKNWPAAVGMALERLMWLRARQEDEADEETRFSIDGFDNQGLQGPALGIAEQQYAATSAVFEWLADGDNESPWQDNLG